MTFDLKKILSISIIIALSMLPASCTSDENIVAPLAVEQSTPVTLVEKMTVKIYNGSDVIITGIFDFHYNSNKQVDSITKNVFNSGNLENSTFYYTYSGDKIISHRFKNEPEKFITYDSNDNLLNMGYGDNIQYFPNGNLKIDSHGQEYVYTGNNLTGPISSPNLYGYDNNPNPFTNANRYFRFLFDENFEAYNCKFIFISENNIISQGGGYPYTYNIIYNDNQFPLEINAVSNIGQNTTISFEYIDL